MCDRGAASYSISSNYYPSLLVHNTSFFVARSLSLLFVLFDVFHFVFNNELSRHPAYWAPSFMQILRFETVDEDQMILRRLLCCGEAMSPLDILIYKASLQKSGGGFGCIMNPSSGGPITGFPWNVLQLKLSRISMKDAPYVKGSRASWGTLMAQLPFCTFIRTMKHVHLRLSSAVGCLWSAIAQRIKPEKVDMPLSASFFLTIFWFEPNTETLTYLAYSLVKAEVSGRIITRSTCWRIPALSLYFPHPDILSLLDRQTRSWQCFFPRKLFSLRFPPWQKPIASIGKGSGDHPRTARNVFASIRSLSATDWGGSSTGFGVRTQHFCCVCTVVYQEISNEIHENWGLYVDFLSCIGAILVWCCWLQSDVSMVAWVSVIAFTISYSISCTTRRSSRVLLIPQ